MPDKNAEYYLASAQTMLFEALALNGVGRVKRIVSAIGKTNPALSLPNDGPQVVSVYQFASLAYSFQLSWTGAKKYLKMSLELGPLDYKAKVAKALITLHSLEQAIKEETDPRPQKLAAINACKNVNDEFLGKYAIGGDYSLEETSINCFLLFCVIQLMINYLEGQSIKVDEFLELHTLTLVCNTGSNNLDKVTGYARQFSIILDGINHFYEKASELSNDIQCDEIFH